MSGLGIAFPLYVADDTPNSRAAETSLGRICERYFLNRHHIEVIDVLRQPERALAAGVFVTPTLVKTAPLPTRVVTGTLDDWDTTLMELARTGVAR